MSNEELTQNWERLFPNFSPIAHELKHKFKDRWFRIHTLPCSKRYPEKEHEYIEIFRRHNLILSDIFGQNTAFYLLTSSSNLLKNKHERVEKIQRLGLQKNYWLNYSHSEDDESPVVYTYQFFDRLDWQDKSLNELFRLVANDEVWNVMLFSTEKNIVYHPYDGGADIIFENSEPRDFYKEKYKDWLSKHPKGL